LDPEASNARIPVVGPQALSPLEVISIFEQTTGRPFSVSHVPVDALEAQLAAAEDPTEKSFAGLLLRCACGDPVVTARVPASVQLPMKTVAEHAADTLASVEASR
jgi:uncharacterized protein YbjT (DUF2867 family)